MNAVAAIAAAGILLAAPLKVTLTAPTHTPKIGAKWPYVVHATRGGRPAAARITVQIVDPLGTAHAVEFGANKKHVTNWPFKGVFRDYVIWPRSSLGVPLTFRVIVVVGATKKVINYKVTSHA